MFPQTIIAFGHRKQVGKDSAAKFLCSYIRMNQNNSNCQIKGFADKVKDIAYQIYSWAGLMPGEYYESDETQKFKDIVLPAIGKTPRDLWIAVGNGIRAMDLDWTWAEYLFRNCNCSQLIIKDLRFPTECEYIKKYGGLVIKIERPGQLKVTDGADDPLEGYTGWSQIIRNDGTLKDFNRKITELAQEILRQSTAV